MNNFPNDDDPQRLMALSIMRPLDNDSIDPNWVDGSWTSSFANKFIKPSKTMSCLERLEVYNQQYWYRVLDSLRDDFPGLLAVLGDDRFTGLAVSYLSKYPSTSFTLRNLGDRLLKFINEEPNLFTEKDRCLVLDMVNFEWSEIQAFDAEEKPTLDPVELSNFAGSKLKLELQPYVFVLSLDHAVDEFLLNHKKFADSRTVTTATKRNREIQRTRLSKPKKQKTFVVIHRQDNCVFYKRINTIEYTVLSALKSGSTLLEACSSIRKGDLQSIRDLSVAVNALGESFALWSRLGWFCAQGSIKMQKPIGRG